MNLRWWRTQSRPFNYPGFKPFRASEFNTNSLNGASEKWSTSAVGNCWCKFIVQGMWLYSCPVWISFLHVFKHNLKLLCEFWSPKWFWTQPHVFKIRSFPTKICWLNIHVHTSQTVALLCIHPLQKRGWWAFWVLVPRCWEFPSSLPLCSRYTHYSKYPLYVPQMLV